MPGRDKKVAGFGEEQMRSLGRQLRELREARSWSLKRLAAESGISVAAIQKIESGDTKPSLVTILAIADTLGEPVDRLIARSRAASSAVTLSRGILPNNSALLCTELAQPRMGGRIIVLPPRRGADDLEIAGPMLFYVLDGQVRFVFADRAAETLGTGDAIHVSEGPAPHCINLLARRSRLLCVEDRRAPTDRHLEFA